MESEKLSKLKKAMGTAASVMRFFEILCIIGAVLSAVVILLSIHYDLPLSDFHFSVFGYPLSDSASSIAIHIVFAALAVLAFGLVFFLFRYLEKSCRAMQAEDSPFNDANYHRMKIAAILITILVVLQGDVALGFVTGLTLFCFLRFFAYGCELQKLSDETL